MCKSNFLCQNHRRNHTALRKTAAAFWKGRIIQCGEGTYFQLNFRPYGWNHLPAANFGSWWKLRRPWAGADMRPNWRVSFWRTSCLHDIGSVFGIQPPSWKQQALSQSSVRAVSAKLSHLFQRVVAGTTAGAATFTTCKATKQKEQRRSCSVVSLVRTGMDFHFISYIALFKAKEKKRQLTSVELCSP